MSENNDSQLGTNATTTESHRQSGTSQSKTTTGTTTSTSKDQHNEKKQKTWPFLASSRHAVDKEKDEMSEWSEWHIVSPGEATNNNIDKRLQPYTCDGRKGDEENIDDMSTWDAVSRTEGTEPQHPGYHKNTFSGSFELAIGSHKVFSRSYVGSKYHRCGRSG